MLQHKSRTLLLIALASLTACTVSVSTGNYPPFVKAAQRGDTAEAERLLRSGELVNQKTIGNQTALHVAAAEGRDQMVLWLLAHEADPFAKDLNGNTPADFARMQGKSHTEELIKDQVHQYQEETTAVQNGNKAALKELLIKDARHYSLLHLFAQVAATQQAKQEIESGADVNARTALELTPLHKAMVGGQVEIARALLNANADVNARDVYNNTPLYYASFFGNKEMVSLLLAAGADKTIRSVLANESPLDLAKRLEKRDVIPLLEDKR